MSLVNINKDSSKSKVILEQNTKEIEQKEKSKTLEYNNLTKENVNDRPKIKKKTIFK